MVGTNQTIAPNLQQAIEQAGSPVRLLWKPNAERWSPPVIPPEWTGWREELTAGFETVALSDLSHHIPNLTFYGPDALRFLSDHLVNNFSSFEVGQAKQVVGVDLRGYFIGDGILTRNADDAFTLNSVPFLGDWLRYQSENGPYEVELTFDPDSAHRGGADPSVFRYQVQGPNALELVERVFDGPLPKTKFFHSTEVELDGRRFRALRHGMTGQPGYEFFGPWENREPLLGLLLQHGATLGVRRVGAMAYSLNGIESGWVPIPTGAIYDGDAFTSYRESLSLFSFEGMNPLHGTYYSPNIVDYYCTPYELGYGRLIDFTHDFHGRDALQQLRDIPARERVTLVLDADGAQAVWGGPEIGFEQTYGRYRIEAEGELVGVAYYTGSISHANTVMALALVDGAHAAPGTRVVFVWGEHPGDTAAAGVDSGFIRIDATVQPSPYNSYARTDYRNDE